MTSMTDIVERVGSLPPLPDTALKLMGVVNNPLSTVDNIVEVIKYDQALTGDVLRLCNSAFLGASHKISSLDEAVLRLGTTKVLHLVMSAHANSVLGREQRGYGLEPGMLWRHSVAVALASSILGKKLKHPDIGTVFTAGLLHDIGKVVLNEFVADELVEIVRRMTKDRISFVESEQQVLGFSHQEVGALVAERWGLSDEMVRCIRYHHDPGVLDPPDTLVDIVHMANSVCLLVGVGLGEDGLINRADPEVMERHGLGNHDLEWTGAEMMTELWSVEKSFGDASGGQGVPQKAAQ